MNRLNSQKILSLIDQKKYFVLHALRQTGKTSTLFALMDYLNQEGHYRCLYMNVEMAQSAREDVSRGIKAILSDMGSRARTHHCQVTEILVILKDLIDAILRLRD